MFSRLKPSKTYPSKQYEENAHPEYQHVTDSQPRQDYNYQNPQDYVVQQQFLPSLEWSHQQEYNSPKEYQQPQAYPQLEYQPQQQQQQQQQQHQQEQQYPQDYQPASDYQMPQDYSSVAEYSQMTEVPILKKSRSRKKDRISPMTPEKVPSSQPLIIYPIDSNNVKVLFEGYSKFVNGEYFANCTTVLIKGGPNTIIDTRTVWDEEKIIEALKREGLTCDDIDFLISTHGHSDHTGCNHLFKKAIHIVGFSISFKDQYYLHPNFRLGEEFNIDPSTNALRVIPTPGHTLQDVSVIVHTNIGIIAISGDLFEKVEDLENEYEWLIAGSDNQSLQRRNRKKILEMADYIIPGHGAMFKVPEKFKNIYKNKRNQDTSNNINPANPLNSSFPANAGNMVNNAVN